MTNKRAAFLFRLAQTMQKRETDIFFVALCAFPKTIFVSGLALVLKRNRYNLSQTRKIGDRKRK